MIGALKQMEAGRSAAESGRNFRVLSEAIRCDNGQEFTSRHFLAWGIERKIELVHIEPGCLGAEPACGEFPREAARRMFCSERSKMRVERLLWMRDE